MGRIVDFEGFGRAIECILHQELMANFKMYKLNEQAKNAAEQAKARNALYEAKSESAGAKSAKSDSEDATKDGNTIQSEEKDI